MRATPGSKCLGCFFLDITKNPDGGTVVGCIQGQQRTVVIEGSMVEEYVSKCNRFTPQLPGGAGVLSNVAQLGSRKQKKRQPKENK